MSRTTRRDFRTEAQFQFVRELEGCDRSGGRSFHRLFEDFLTLASCATAQLVYRSDEIESQYMSAVKPYKREQAAHFAHALAIFRDAIAEQPHDFLGEVAGAAGVLNHWHGQFFTPWCLAEAMAAMTLGDVVRKPKRLTVGEPATGGGVMLLAAAVQLERRGFRPQDWWFDATDVDVRCFQMSYLQLSWTGAAGVVRYGNSITMEQWRAWLTPAGARFPLSRPKSEQLAA